MRKIAYNLTLDPEAVEGVREYLKMTGQSLSGFINGLLVEFNNEIKGCPSPLGKNVNQMTMKEFMETMQYWMQRIQEEENDEGTA